MHDPTPAQAQSREIFLEGVDHFEAARWADARACFERCLALTPDRPSVLGNLGITLLRLGRAKEALPWLQRATDADPAFAQAWANLGLAHAATGSWAAASAALQRALQQLPETPALWLALGQCLLRSSRADEALAAFDRALALEPTLADAWSERGGLLRELHRLDEAAASFEQAIAHGADAELHRYYLAAVRGDRAPPAPPRAYVQGLFDDYAPDFERHVVASLGYRGHEVLLRPLLEPGGRRFRRALDLGCGTGLCAPLLAPHCDAIDGVDLSAPMLDEARRRGLYRRLVQADIGEHLAAETEPADLVVAADVLIYLGDPARPFADVARLLEPGGLFAFTVEQPTNGAELQLLPSLRYAHSRAGIERVAAASGLAVHAVREATLRHDQARPVAGLCIVLRQPGNVRAAP